MFVALVFHEQSSHLLIFMLTVYSKTTTNARLWLKLVRNPPNCSHLSAAAYGGFLSVRMRRYSCGIGSICDLFLRLSGLLPSVWARCWSVALIIMTSVIVMDIITRSR